MSMELAAVAPAALPTRKDGGLTTEEARALRARYGANEPAARKGYSPATALVRFVASPLVLLLAIAAAVSALLGQHVDAVIIALMVLLGVAIDFVQTYRSARAVERLQASVAPTATVLRDGQWQELPRRELVPGDLVKLSAGDLVPADCRLLGARDLHVTQAALTGESLPVEKQALPQPPVRDADAEHMVLLGTSVVSGTATAEVIWTGAATSFGDIAARLAHRPPPTAFERGTRQFGLLIARTVMLLVLFIVTVSVLMHRDPFQSLLFAVALAVGLTPEFLPMITTVTLARGAVRMAKQQVIVKQLSAIQNFGSIDILCSDKTGTLTSGSTALERFVDARGEEAPRVLEHGWLNARHETGIKSPLDAAILQRPPPPDNDWRKTDEIPFDFERRRVSVVLQRGAAHLLITKGAPESVLPLCGSLELDGARVPFGEAEWARAAETFAALSRDGYRVLAVAIGEPARPDGLDAGDERALTLLGFLGFADPPLPEASQTLARLRADGVEVKILTGDHEAVARHVCKQVGLDIEDVVTGAEIDRMSDAALGARAEEAKLFARLSPAQKNRILSALKARGHVVGFMGDGINDAPSLRAADVGISVASAVDVAKDAAEIILVRPGLDVLHTGILEGRRAFGNVLKYLLMGTSSNFGNMLSMAGASLFLPFLPMLPTQILLNNFLYDLAQVTIPTDRVDGAYTVKPRKWEIRGIRNFMIWIGPLSSIYDFLTFFVLLALFRAGEPEFHTGWFVESLATQTLVLFVIRTAGRPWRSRPSRALAGTVLMTTAIAVALPYTPIARALGFVPLPPSYFAFLFPATITYLVLVELVKSRLMKKIIT